MFKCSNGAANQVGCKCANRDNREHMFEMPDVMALKQNDMLFGSGMCYSWSECFNMFQYVRTCESVVQG